uniref:Pentatricopeptide repeat-containing protein n=1 Tax=Tanacetum cinerariifolium TaxID=118510 RepID=A0A6L2J2M2_TANCI|nr:pentatricopeptide repeat-containing protein [Tanacetum cinerariifolium]
MYVRHKISHRVPAAALCGYPASVYVNGFILEMAVRRMPYEQFAEFFKEKSGNLFQGPLKKRYCNAFSLNEMVDWAEIEVEPKGVETSNNNIDKALMQQMVLKLRLVLHTIAKKSDDESDYQLYKLINYLSPGEEELIELRNKMKANRVAKAKAKDNPDSEMNEPNNENNMLADNVRANDFSLWYERSGEAMVVAKCGQRKRRLFDLEKVDLVMEKHKCKVSPNQCTNAKMYALAKYEKTVCEHYAMLRSYGKAILYSNHGSIVKLEVTVNPDGKTYFDRVPQSYVPAWFETDMYFVTYHNFFKPVPRMNFWPDQSMYSTVLPPKPIKKRIRAICEGGSLTRASKRGLVRDEGARGSKGGASGSRGRRGAGGLRGDASGSKLVLVGLEVVLVFLEELLVGLEEVLVGLVVLVGQEVKVLVGLVVLVGQESQDEPQQTQHEPMQTQNVDQVEQTQEQAEIDLTQMEQT